MEWMLLPFRRYAQFSGRSRRKEYWMYTLFLVIVSIVLSIIENVTGLARTLGPYGPLTAILGAATLLPSLAVSVRRLHDTDRTGWWILLPIIPYALLGYFLVSQNLAMMGIAGLVALACLVVLLFFMCSDGTKGPNRFGADPKAPDQAEVFA